MKIVELEIYRSPAIPAVQKRNPYSFWKRRGHPALQSDASIALKKFSNSATSRTEEIFLDKKNSLGISSQERCCTKLGKNVFSSKFSWQISGWGLYFHLPRFFLGGGEENRGIGWPGLAMKAAQAVFKFVRGLGQMVPMLCWQVGIRMDGCRSRT